MGKSKTKPKAAGGGGTGTQIVKLKPGKPKISWFRKVPPIKSYAQNVRQFLAEVVSELRKVTWPSRKETLGATGVVLVLVIILAAYLGLVDYILSHLVRYLIG